MFIIFYYFSIFLQKVILKKKKIYIFNKENLYKWMNLTKKERYDLNKKDSFSYLQKRKSLLEQIRKEYKSVSYKKKK